MSNTCPLCSGKLSNVDMFSASDLLTNVAGSFCYKKCETCGSYIQDPIPSQDFLNKCYYEQALTYKKPQELTTKINWFEGKLSVVCRIIEIALLKIINKIFPNRINTINLIPSKPKGAKVLEFGAAYGKHLSELKNLGYDVVGVEPTLESCQKAKELYNLDLINKTIEEVDFENESFDVIIMSMVLEHVRNPKNIIEKCFQLLKKDGELLISIPTSDGFEFKKFKQFCYITQPPYHITLPSKNGFEYLIKDWFKIVDIQYQYTGDRDLCFSASFEKPTKPDLLNKFLSIGYNKIWFQSLVRIFLIIGVNFFKLKTSRASFRLQKVK